MNTETNTVAPGMGDALEFLKDPSTVHAMMLRGQIAIPSWRNIVDLRGEVPNGEDVQLARIAELQEALAAQPAPVVGGGDFNGDTPHLIECIKALVSIFDAGRLAPHGLGGHARGMLLAAANRLAARPVESVAADAVGYQWRLKGESAERWAYATKEQVLRVAADDPDWEVRPLYTLSQLLSARPGGEGEAVATIVPHPDDFTKPGVLWHRKDFAIGTKLYTHPSTAGGDDTKRLDWLVSNEASLVMHPETWNVEDPECEYSIWWNVAKGGKSISGHPLGDAREAIDAAMAAHPAQAGGEVES